MDLCVLCSLVPRPLPDFISQPWHTASDGKLGGAWERGYVLCASAAHSLLVHVPISLCCFSFTALVWPGTAQDQCWLSRILTHGALCVCIDCWVQCVGLSN